MPRRAYEPPTVTYALFSLRKNDKLTIKDHFGTEGLVESFDMSVDLGDCLDHSEGCLFARKQLSMIQ